MEVRKQHLADKEASESKAKNTMIEKKADAEAAGKLREQHKQEKEKADAAMQAARAALEAQQKILEDAVSSLEVATAEAEKATSQTEHLAGIHRKQKDSLAMLLEVRESIKDFYTHMDALTMSMEKAAAKQPDMPAPQLLRGDSHLKPALESYNDVVKAFREAHSFDEGLYSTIRGAVPEIKQNSWSAILLQCDPGEILEKQAEEANNFDELQDKCGTGLWNAVGVQRLHFPTYQGTSEQLDEWWDQHVETPAAPASSARSEEMVEEAEPVAVSEKILPEPDMHAPSTTKPEPVEQIVAEQEEEESVKAMPTTTQAAMEQPHSEAEDMDAFGSAETKEKEAEAVESTAKEAEAAESAMKQVEAVESTTKVRAPAAETTTKEAEEAESITKEAEAPAVETTTKEAEEVESITKEVEALAVETTTKEAEEAESITKEVEAPAVETTTKEADEAESITKEAEAPAAETTTKEAEEAESITKEVEAVAVETTTKEADDAESIMKELEAAESTTQEVDAVESTTKEVEAVEATTKEVEALEPTTKKIHDLESTTKNVEDLLSEMESLPASTSISSSLQPLPSNVKEDHHEATPFEIDDHEDTFSPSKVADEAPAATTTTEALEGPEPDLMQDLSLPL